MSKKILLFSLPLLLIFGSCKNDSDNAKALQISNELNQILNKKEKIPAEMKKDINIFSQENINGFPSNRSALEPIAKRRIEQFGEMIKFDELQIEKLEEAEKLNLEPNLIEFMKVSNTLCQKTIKLSNLRIQSYQLFLDPNISTQQKLKDSLTAN